jgi:hypothetical protein
MTDEKETPPGRPEMMDKFLHDPEFKEPVRGDVSISKNEISVVRGKANIGVKEPDYAVQAPRAS